MPANRLVLKHPRRELPPDTPRLPVDADAPADCAHKKDLQIQAFCEAAEGIRTLDLLLASRTCLADSTRIRLQTGGFWPPTDYEGFPAFTGDSREFG
jgi:hypothetical protein